MRGRMSIATASEVVFSEICEADVDGYCLVRWLRGLEIHSPDVADADPQLPQLVGRWAKCRVARIYRRAVLEQGDMPVAHGPVTGELPCAEVSRAVRGVRADGATGQVAQHSC